MPRRARIDAAGALQHIICRGIQRCRIYRDESDRKDFFNRLGQIIGETRTTCYAWALMPNHFHLLLGEFKFKVQHHKKAVDMTGDLVM
jgi:putative transposase